MTQDRERHIEVLLYHSQIGHEENGTIFFRDSRYFVVGAISTEVGQVHGRFLGKENLNSSWAQGKFQRPEISSLKPQH